MEGKRVAPVGGEGERWRCWEGMSPELLALIFERMPADVICRAVPFVCRSWREAVAGPHCWSDVDLEQWCRRVDRSDVIDFAVRRLVRRSQGTIRRLSAYRLGNSGFAFTASSAKFLKVLQIPMSEVTDQTAEKHAASLSSLTFLDISYCLNITSKGIEALGKHCKSLVHLRRNLPPPDSESGQVNGVAAIQDEGEAMAIASTMTGLQHLELGYGRFSNSGLGAILTNCAALCNLDIHGCWSVKINGDTKKRCYAIKDFRDPLYDEYNQIDSLDDENSKSEDDDAALVDVDTSEESDDD